MRPAAVLTALGRVRERTSTVRAAGPAAAPRPASPRSSQDRADRRRTASQIMSLPIRGEAGLQTVLAGHEVVGRKAVAKRLLDRQGVADEAGLEAAVGGVVEAALIGVDPAPLWRSCRDSRTAGLRRAAHSEPDLAVAEAVADQVAMEGLEGGRGEAAGLAAAPPGPLMPAPSTGRASRAPRRRSAPNAAKADRWPRRAGVRGPAGGGCCGSARRRTAGRSGAAPRGRDRQRAVAAAPPPRDPAPAPPRRTAPPSRARQAAQDQLVPAATAGQLREDRRPDLGRVGALREQAIVLDIQRIESRLAALVEAQGARA